MFAVGSNSLMTPYTFYDYTTASGFMDTSTMNTVIQSSIQSTIQGTPKTIISTIPYTQWSNSGTVTTYPFYYASTFQVTTSTILSPIQQTFTSTVTSNIYGPPVTLYPSSTPIYPNPFISTYTYTFQSTIPSFISTSVSFGTIVSTGALAVSYTFDFISTSYTEPTTYPSVTQTPNVWLGDGLSKLIQSKQYNVLVDCQYSLELNSETTSNAWVDTIGNLGNVVGSPSQSGLIGQKVTTRVGTGTYTQLTNSFLFKPDTTNQTIGINASNFFISINVRRSASETGIVAPDYDIYIPGSNNFRFTLIPI
jgi:hypothetical protein